MTSRYADLSREQLATLVPELLLIGQLIDRSGMAWCISNFGREEMLQIAIEEWMGCQPDLHQADAEGAEVRGRRRRHDLQGPAARHRRPAAVHGLPLHRARPLARRVPPRPLRRAAGRRADGRGLRPRHVPRHRGPDVRRHRGGHQPQGADPPDPPAAAGTRRPAPALRMDGDHRRVVSARSTTIPAMDVMRRTRAARTELDPIDPDDEGQSDYSGALVSDFDFGAFSHSALVRMADEVCLQMHLLNLSFVIAVGKRAGTNTELATEICTKQLIGIAGIAAERIHHALDLPGGIEGAIRTLELHPMFNPAAYVTAEFGPDTVACAQVARTRGRGMGLVGRPGRDAAAAGDCRRRRSASRRGGRRDRHRLDGTRDRDRHGGKGIPRGVGGAGSAAAATFVFEPRKSLPLTVV